MSPTEGVLHTYLNQDVRYCTDFRMVESRLEGVNVEKYRSGKEAVFQELA
jgi:hypothetical protein